MAISRIRTCQRCKVLLPHFQFDRTAKYLKFCSALPFGLTTNNVTWNPFHTSALPILRKMWSTASALPSCLSCQRYEVQLLHISSAMPGLLKVWSFASAIPLCLCCQRSEVPPSVLPLIQDFERSRSSSALVLQGLPNMGKSTSAFHVCRDFQRCEVPLPHFCSALPWLPKIWSSAFRTSARPGLERSRSSSTLVLPGLPNMDKSTSAFHLCQDFQRSKISLPRFCFLSSAVHSCYAFPHKFVRF